jgi:SsrA-binding protein
LLTKREITKLAERTHKTGSTVRVIDIYISHKGFIKLTIGITKVMKKIDKKNKLKEKDTIRETDREIKNIVFK